MDEKIKNFLEKWNEMLAAANEIEEFKYELKISISSDNKYVAQREETIRCINMSFVKHNMKYRSTSQN